MFGVCVQTAHNWVEKYGMPAQRMVGGGMRFDPDDVVDYLEENNLFVPDELLARTKRGQ